MDTVAVFDVKCHNSRELENRGGILEVLCLLERVKYPLSDCHLRWTSLMRSELDSTRE